MGADRSVLVIDDAFAGADLLVTAAALAGALGRESPDLVRLRPTVGQEDELRRLAPDAPASAPAVTSRSAPAKASSRRAPERSSIAKRLPSASSPRRAERGRGHLTLACGLAQTKRLPRPDACRTRERELSAPDEASRGRLQPPSRRRVRTAFTQTGSSRRGAGAARRTEELDEPPAARRG